MVKTNAWSEKAINEFEKISNAESLIFHYDCHASGQHIYGSLEVKTYTGKSVNMNDLLKNLEEAVDATDFEKGTRILIFFLLLQQILNLYYETDSGNHSDTDDKEIQLHRNDNHHAH